MRYLHYLLEKGGRMIEIKNMWGDTRNNDRIFQKQTEITLDMKYVNFDFWLIFFWRSCLI